MWPSLPLAWPFVLSCTCGYVGLLQSLSRAAVALYQTVGRGSCRILLKQLRIISLPCLGASGIATDAECWERRGRFRGRGGERWEWAETVFFTLGPRHSFPRALFVWSRRERKYTGSPDQHHQCLLFVKIWRFRIGPFSPLPTPSCWRSSIQS